MRELRIHLRMCDTRPTCMTSLPFIYVAAWMIEAPEVRLREVLLYNALTHITGQSAEPDVRISLLLCFWLLCCYSSMSANGVVVSAIDNLPAQVPRESTDYFGSKMLPLMKDCVSEVCTYVRMHVSSRVHAQFIY